MTPRLSTITRTFERPLLLERAAQSVLAASIPGMEWIVVDDGPVVSPETQRIVALVAAAGTVQAQAVCSARAGRTRAANLGLATASGQYIHLHDDDDTVAPGFYRTTLDFLDEQPRYKGVRAMCWRIYETLSGTYATEIKRERVYPERQVVSLLAAAEVFAYPPIGTVLDRQIMVDIGGFDEQFEVAEDYDLLLRFLLKADIGTLNEALAYVHTRQASSDSYANSPIARNFIAQDALFRDQKLRDDINAGTHGLGWLLVMGALSRKNLTLLDYLNAARKRLGL